MFKIMIGIFVFTLFSNAYTDINECTMSDKGERLKCYDDISMFGKNTIKNGKELFKKCAGCHGASGEVMALGKSAVLAGQSESELVTKLKEYKLGTRNIVGMGMLMKGQTLSLSDDDIRIVSKYISSFPVVLSKKKSKKTVSKNIESFPVDTVKKKKKIDISHWDSSITKSLMGDSKTVVLTTNGINDGGIETTMIIRCKKNKTSLYFLYQYTFMGTNGQTARIKFDNDKPYKKWVSASSDGSALFYDSPIKFLKKMMKHKTMIFEASPYSKVSTQTKFNISNLDKVIDPLRKECKW